MKRAVLTAVPVLVTSLTSTTPRRLAISTRSPFMGVLPAGTWSVRRERGIDLVDPGQHPAADVHRVGEAGVLDDRQGLGRTGAALAVQHDPLVLRQLLQRGPGQELTLRDERRAGDGDDLVFVRLADVDEEDVVAGVQHGRQVLGADRRALD